ncbi:RNA polymerase sigma factor [Kitasatospora sp. LaBMicrA B282]|uniref:RNA polymerase sigma factor n=1 Tax=Kitasatospora sp. LaBMicrA B282 TaxID=3420949 RepID=UPI003D13858A
METPGPAGPEPHRAAHPLEQAPDGLLAGRATDGDDTAFEILVRRHGGRLLALATRLLDNTTEAEDAVQESFVAAWRRLPDFRGDAEFGTWMYRIVTNRCLNVLRARRPTQPLDGLPEPAALDHQSSPALLAESRASSEALARALHTLTPEQRACWVLRELHGLGYEDIASAVGIGEPAVRGRIHRARRALTEVMQAWR